MNIYQIESLYNVWTILLLFRNVAAQPGNPE